MNFKPKLLQVATFLLVFINSAAWAEHLSAPNCELTSLDENQSYNLQQYQGKVVYVDFWASWCGPCVASFPFMNKLHQDLKDKGLAVVAVNLDENRDEGQAFVTEHPVNFAVATDSKQKCARDFQVKAMPSSFLIDRSGKIREVHLGFRAGEAEQFRQVVEQVLAENPAKP